MSNINGLSAPQVKIDPSVVKEAPKFNTGLMHFACVRYSLRSKVLELIAKLRLEEVLGQNRVAIPTHVLEELGFEYKKVARDNMATIFGFVDLKARMEGNQDGAGEMFYTPGAIEIDQVSGHTAFGYFIPFTKVEETELLQQALIDAKLVTGPIDFIDVKFDYHTVSITQFGDKSHLKKLRIRTLDAKKREVEEYIEIKGPVDYMDTLKESFDKMSDKSKREHIEWLAKLDPALRADRRILRDFFASGILIEQYNEEHEEGQSHEEYLANLIDIHAGDLKQFEGIDCLDDETYIEAVEKLICAEAEMAWKEANKNGEVPNGKTFEHWIIENYGRPFDEIHHTFLHQEFPNRFTALDLDDEGEEEEDITRVHYFGVTLDGTIYEEPTGDMLVGTESPFAIATLKKIRENGHAVTLFAENRSEKDLSLILEELEKRGLTFTSVNRQVANDYNRGVSLSNMSINNLGIDFLIDKRCIFSQTNALSNPKKQTLMWAPIVSRLVDLGILQESDMDEIRDSLNDTYAALEARTPQKEEAAAE